MYESSGFRIPTDALWFVSFTRYYYGLTHSPLDEAIVMYLGKSNCSKLGLGHI